MNSVRAITLLALWVVGAAVAGCTGAAVIPPNLEEH